MMRGEYKLYIIMHTAVHCCTVATRRGLHWSCPSAAVATAGVCFSRSSVACPSDRELRPAHDLALDWLSWLSPPAPRGRQVSVRRDRPDVRWRLVQLYRTERDALTAEMYCIRNLPDTGRWGPYSSGCAVEHVGTGLQYCCRLSVQLPTRAGDGVILSVVRAFVSATRSRVCRSGTRYNRPYKQSATQTRNGSPSTCVRHNGAQLAGRYVYPIRLACRPAAGHRSGPTPFRRIIVVSYRYRRPRVGRSPVNSYNNPYQSCRYSRRRHRKDSSV